jgi:hypothetical protein
MKRSKIFLGMTTCLLAVVAVAATKAHKFFTNTKLGYYKPIVNGACVLDNNYAWYTYGVSGTHDAITKGSPSGTRTVFTNLNCAGKVLFSSTFAGE